MRYSWQKCPNPDVMILHVSVRLPRAEYNDIFGRVTSGPLDETPLDGEDRELVEAIHDVEGVVSVYMRDYECQIEKGELFEWSDLKPGIIEAFRRRFKPNGTLTEIPARQR